MGEVRPLPTSAAQRALALFREEERAFRIVLEVLRVWQGDAVFLRVFSVYRARMRHLRRLAGTLLDSADAPSAVEELRRFARERGPG